MRVIHKNLLQNGLTSQFELENSKVVNIDYKGEKVGILICVGEIPGVRAIQV